MQHDWNYKLVFSGDHWLSLKSQQDNMYFITIIQGALYNNFPVLSGFVFCRKLAHIKTQQGIDKVIKHNGHTVFVWDLILITCKSTGVVSNSSHHLSSLNYTSSPFESTSCFVSAFVTNIVSHHWHSMPPPTESSHSSVWAGIQKQTTAYPLKHQTRMIRWWWQQRMYNTHGWLLIAVYAPYFHHS